MNYDFLCEDTQERLKYIYESDYVYDIESLSQGSVVVTESARSRRIQPKPLTAEEALAAVRAIKIRQTEKERAKGVLPDPELKLNCEWSRELLDFLLQDKLAKPEEICMSILESGDMRSIRYFYSLKLMDTKYMLKCTDREMLGLWLKDRE